MKIKLNAPHIIDNTPHNAGDVVEVGDSTGKSLLTLDVNGNPMITKDAVPLCVEAKGNEAKEKP